MELVPDESKKLVKDVVKQAVFLEDKLDELRELPFISVNPSNPAMQKNTIAGKLYKDLLQQYNSCIKIVEGVIYRDKRLDGEELEESPLRKWVNNHAD